MMVPARLDGAGAGTARARVSPSHFGRPWRDSADVSCAQRRAVVVAPGDAEATHPLVLAGLV